MTKNNRKEAGIGLWERGERLQIGKTLYTITRPVALREGLFKEFIGSIDFLIKNERDQIADLLESLETLAEQNIASAIKRSIACRKLLPEARNLGGHF